MSKNLSALLRTGSNTPLTIASTTVLGGVKVDNSTITINGSGVISAAPYSLTATTTTTLGGVIIPVVGTSGITNTSGTIGLATATQSQLGGIKIDNSTITINNGVISATGFLPVAGGTLTGLLTTKTLALTKTAPAIASFTGYLTIDCSLGNFFAVSLTQPILGFTIINVPETSKYFEFILELTADGTARSVNWSLTGIAVSVKWPTGTAPTLTSTSGKKDVFVIYTYDAGTTWLGFVAGQNL